MPPLPRILANRSGDIRSQWPSIVFLILSAIPVLQAYLLVTISGQSQIIQLLRPIGTAGAAGMLFYAAYLEQNYKRWAWLCHGAAMACAALFSYLKISQGASITMAPMRSLWILIYLFSFVGTALYLQRRAWWIGSTWRIIIGGLSVGISALVLMQAILPRISALWPWTTQASTVIPSLAFDIGILFAFSAVGLRYRKSGGPLIPYILLCLLCLLIADTFFLVLSWASWGKQFQAYPMPFYTLHSVLLAVAAYRDATHTPHETNTQLATMPLTEWVLWTLVPLAVVIAAFAAASIVGTTSSALIIGLAIVTIAHEILAMSDYHRVTSALHQARLDAVDLATLRERSRIAHELHDVTNYYMTKVMRKLNRALRHVETKPQITRLEITESLTDMKQVLADTRAMSFTLRNGPIQPLEESLRALAPVDDRLSIVLSVTGAPRHLPDKVAFAAYRIVQEAFTNVIKHAPAATQIVVTLDYQPSQLNVTVVDNGQGSTPSAPSPTASGLPGMQERVEEIGGTLLYGRTTYGYQIHAELPMELTDVSDSRVNRGRQTRISTNSAQ